MKSLDQNLLSIDCVVLLIFILIYCGYASKVRSSCRVTVSWLRCVQNFIVSSSFLTGQLDRLKLFILPDLFEGQSLYLRGSWGHLCALILVRALIFTHWNLLVADIMTLISHLGILILFQSLVLLFDLNFPFMNLNVLVTTYLWADVNIGWYLSSIHYWRIFIWVLFTHIYGGLIILFISIIVIWALEECMQVSLW